MTTTFEGSPAPSAKLEIFTLIAEERDRQDAKWGREFPGRRDSFWQNILMEEVGEVSEAILKGDTENMKVELIQCAAVIFSWLELRDGTSEAEVERDSDFDEA